MSDKGPHWIYTLEPNGYYEVRAGGLSVGSLIFEDHAQILVDALNAKEPEWLAKHRGKKAHA